MSSAVRANFGRTFEQLTPGQRATLLGNDRTCGGRVRLCCFHPAYGYEDFLEGFRPEQANGQKNSIAMSQARPPNLIISRTEVKN